MDMLARRQLYKVTADSPRLLSSANGTISTRHLVVIHDISSCEHEIEGNIAKLSLYNLADVTLTLNGRILSSTLEISHCTDLKINFHASAPAVIQVDPEINNLAVHFASGIDPGVFVIAPRPSSAQGLGLARISVKLGENEYLFVDEHGVVDTELLISSGGKVSEQYKIEMIKDGGKERWRMEPIDTYKKDGEIPVLSDSRR